MEVTRYCARKDLNWATLPSLVPKLALDGAPVFSSTYITINRYPDTVTYDSLDEAINDVKKHGAPSNYTIRMYGQSGTRSLYISSGEGYLYLSLDHAVDPAEIDDVTEYLGLIPSEPRTLPPGRPRTAFIAHRFDDESTILADKLARFLELLGFMVRTGRGYVPGPVASKVRARIEQQEVVLVLRTAGEDDAWLIQESALADVHGKPLIIIKESSANFKSGILADHEYIPFGAPHIEQTYIPLLEGLRELGYLTWEEAEDD